MLPPRGGGNASTRAAPSLPRPAAALRPTTSPHADATPNEIAFAAEQIERMPRTTFEELSIPTWVFGFVRTYAQQENVVARIRKAWNREQNKNKTADTTR